MDELTVSKSGIKVDGLSFFIDFIVSGETHKLRGLTTREVFNKIIVPRLKAEGCTTFCDVLIKSGHQATVGFPSLYVIHAWNSQFLDTLNALDYYCKFKSDLAIWIDVFCMAVDNFPIIDFKYLDQSLKSFMLQMNEVIVLLSPIGRPVAFQRSWCIYETYCALQAGKSVSPVVSRINLDLFLDNAAQVGINSVNCITDCIDIQRSVSSNTCHREAILKAVSNYSSSRFVNDSVISWFRDWVYNCIQNALTSERDYEKCIRWTELIGRIKDLQSDYSNAERLLLSCLDMKRVKWGEDHHETLSTMNNLAFVYMQQKDYAKAEPLFLKCLKVERANYGEDDIRTLISMNNLAGLYGECGNHEKAEEMFLGCLSIQRRVLGPHHADTIATVVNCCTLYLNEGRYGAAERLLSGVIAAGIQKLGRANPDILLAMSHLACACDNLQMYDEAETWYRASFEAHKAKFGIHCESSLEAMHALIVFLVERDHFHDAKKLALTCLQHCKEGLGSDHPLTRSVKDTCKAFGTNSKKCP